MKSKLLGISILIIMVLTGTGYFFYRQDTTVTTLNGYLGGEKIGLFEDEEIQKILKKNYHLTMDYSRAGSLDMITADMEGRNYLFPSSQTALEYYQELYGNSVSDEIIFNTPIVLYTHKIVADALVKNGIVTCTDGIYYADMKKFTQLLLEDKQWSDLGLSQLYGNITVDTTDPARSNSGNMFAALLANVLNNGKTVDAPSAEALLPSLQKIFSQLGYMETSSSDLFHQFMGTGVGAKPIIAGYENQLLEYATENPKDFEKVKDDIIILYPTPTVWSTHIYIALDEKGKKGIEALSDKKIQELAWQKHGFRTNQYEINSEDKESSVTGVPKEITSAINLPAYDAMKKIIEGLK